MIIVSFSVVFLHRLFLVNGVDLYSCWSGIDWHCKRYLMTFLYVMLVWYWFLYISSIPGWLYDVLDKFVYVMMVAQEWTGCPACILWFLRHTCVYFNYYLISPYLMLVLLMLIVCTLCFVYNYSNFIVENVYTDIVQYNPSKTNLLQTGLKAQFSENSSF